MEGHERRATGLYTELGFSSFLLLLLFALLVLHENVVRAGWKWQCELTDRADGTGKYKDCKAV